jgi:hypothetical protein
MLRCHQPLTPVGSNAVCVFRASERETIGLLKGEALLVQKEPAVAVQGDTTRTVHVDVCGEGLAVTALEEPVEVLERPPVLVGEVGGPRWGIVILAGGFHVRRAEYLCSVIDSERTGVRVLDDDVAQRSVVRLMQTVGEERLQPLVGQEGRYEDRPIVRPPAAGHQEGPSLAHGILNSDFG